MYNSSDFERLFAHYKAEAVSYGESIQDFSGETGGPMLGITGMNRFYYFRSFRDFRRMNSRVLSIIH